MTAVIDMLLAIPPVRFVMGLVDAQWRPLWAALWLAVIAYILSRTVNQLVLRRARLRLLHEQAAPNGLDTAGSGAGEQAPPEEPQQRSRILKPAPIPARGSAVTPESTPVQIGGTRVPLPVIGAALAVGVVAVALTSLFLQKPEGPSGSSAPGAPVDATPPTDTALDVRWRSGRMDGDDCIGTFEVTRGTGTRAQFVAFVMDTTGAIVARDSARVASAVGGLLVEFRFRHVDCDAIDDWQLQATTPKTDTNGAQRSP
jgi:hypothetical protein